MSEHASPSIEKEPEPVSPNPTVEKCLAFVEDYRRDKLTKSGAIYGIIGAIAEASEITEQDQREVAVGSYISRLDQHDTFRSDTARRGSGRSGSRSRTYEGREEDEQEDTVGENRLKRP